ncbi:hypothetical protein [Paraburkholderia sp. GAS348]
MRRGWSNGTPTDELVTACSGIEKTCNQLYDTGRPHNSLGDLTPEQFARAHEATQQSLTSDSDCGPD